MAQGTWWRTAPGAFPPRALHGITARPIGSADLGFLSELYASTRADEMAQAGWPEAQCRRFLAWQFDLQHRYYQAHSGDADFLLLLRGDHPIGRLYWREGDDSASLIDVSLLPAERGRGVGTALMQVITERSDRHGRAIVLHVEPTNPAHRLYGRFGFEVVADNGVYLKMLRPAQADAATALEAQP